MSTIARVEAGEDVPISRGSQRALVDAQHVARTHILAIWRKDASDCFRNCVPSCRARSVHSTATRNGLLDPMRFSAVDAARSSANGNR